MLLLSASAQAGGAERSFLSLASCLPGQGLEPRVVLLERGPLERWLDQAGLPYIVAPDGTGRSADAAIRWLARETARPGAVAVVSNKSQSHLVGAPVAESADLPAVWWQQDIAGRAGYELAAAALRNAAVVCSSDYAVEAQRALTPAADVRKIHLGVSVAEVVARRGAGTAIRRRLGLDGRPLVGIVGRLERWKGQEVFLRAAARVASEHPAATFAIVGGVTPGKPEEYVSGLEVLARELGLDGRVHFTGHEADVFPWFDALDLCVHATHGEPFGLVLVEAMALGKPLVATALGGPVEIVEEGVSGLLVPPGDEEAMALAIGRVLSEPELASRLAEGGSRRAYEFTDVRMAASFAGLLRELVSP